jgi:hypothetical protein
MTKFDHWAKHQQENEGESSVTTFRDLNFIVPRGLNAINQKNGGRGNIVVEG